MLSTTERSASSDLLRTAYRDAMQTVPMEIAQNIRAARAKSGMSQRILAKKLRVAPSAVAQWETGATIPTIARRVDISRLLHIPFVQLVPEAAVSAEASIRDPQIFAIVQQLLKLPEPVREAVLMQAAATVEALEGLAAPDKQAG